MLWRETAYDLDLVLGLRSAAADTRHSLEPQLVAIVSWLRPCLMTSEACLGWDDTLTQSDDMCHVSRVSHVSLVQAHVNWIPGQRHFQETQSGQKLGKTVPKWKKTCRTRVSHVSRVWDHDHWIPGKILTCLHVNNFSVAHLEPELGLKPTKKKRGALKKKLRGSEKN